MLTKHQRNARPIADRDARHLLALHRRIELLVALLVVAAVAVLVVEAEPATAQSLPSAPPEEPAADADADADALEFEASPSDANPDPDPVRDASALRITDVRTSPSRIFLGSRRQAAFGFELDGGARELLVKLVGVRSREVVRRYRLGRVEEGSRRRLTWDGKLNEGGYAPEGEYAFRVFSEGERAAVSRESAGQRLGFYGHRFPLLAKHTYGDGFGAGRNHQGQDIFAACGTRVAAARGGRVQARSFHSAAGYYVVIDGRNTGQDYVYMHLERAARPAEGAWVSTGELVGRESDTGNASGCHLHFELWSAPGWYEGGHAKPATEALQRWDGWS